MSFGGSRCSQTLESFVKEGTSCPNMSADEDPLLAGSSAIVPVFDQGNPSGEVTVTYPETQTDSMLKKFTTYLVSGNLNGRIFRSRHRYSDFVWFRTALGKNLPGVFLPSLPGKLLVGKFDAAFLEDRRAGLQLFLVRLFQRQDVSVGLPLVLRFLTCTPDLETMKAEFDRHPVADIYQDYQNVFAETLANNTPPKSDKGFQMVKEFLDKHVPALKAAQSSVVALFKAHEVLTSKMVSVGKALEKVAEEEAELLEAAGASATDLRSDSLIRLSRNIEIERSSTDLVVLNACLQRELDDCESVQECISSIEVLQHTLLTTRTRLQSDTASLAKLRGDPNAQDDSSWSSSPTDSTDELRKRDKVKNFFGNLTSAGQDFMAKAGGNKEKRIAELGQSIDKYSSDITALELFIQAARTVCSSSEITAFLETKVAGCLWGQVQFAEKKAALHRELAECWTLRG